MGAICECCSDDGKAKRKAYKDSDYLNAPPAPSRESQNPISFQSFNQQTGQKKSATQFLSEQQLIRAFTQDLKQNPIDNGKWLINYIQTHNMDAKYGELFQLANIPVTSNWTNIISRDQNDVNKVEMNAIKEGDLHTYKVNFEMNCHALDYFYLNLFKTDQERNEIDSQVLEERILQKVTFENQIYFLCYLRCKPINLLVKSIPGKEFLVIKTIRQISARCFIEIQTSIEHPKVPHHPDNTRAKIFVGGIIYNQVENPGEPYKIQATICTKMDPDTIATLWMLKGVLKNYNQRYINKSWEMLAPYLRQMPAYPYEEKLKRVPTKF